MCEWTYMLKEMKQSLHQRIKPHILYENTLHVIRANEIFIKKLKIPAFDSVIHNKMLITEFRSYSNVADGHIMYVLWSFTTAILLQYALLIN